MAAVSFPPVVPSLTIAGRVFTDVENIIHLRGFAVGTTNVRSSFRKMTGSSAYQVPVGKKFVVKAIRCMSTVSATSPDFMFMITYTDNDVGVAQSTAFTNPIYAGGSPNLASFGTLSEIKDDVQEFVCDFEAIASKYLGMQVLATAANYVAVDIFGYEVPA